jgi:small subunit ribosomal protein S8
MSVTDLVADQLTVIRNAIKIGRESVIIKRSKMLVGILDIAKREGFIENYQPIEDNKQGTVKVYLKYTEDGLPVISGLKKISKCGRREHVQAKAVDNVLGGVGIAVISTNKGLLTDTEAREQGVGGEVICQIW